MMTVDNQLILKVGYGVGGTMFAIALGVVQPHRIILLAICTAYRGAAKIENISDYCVCDNFYNIQGTFGGSGK